MNSSSPGAAAASSSSLIKDEASLVASKLENTDVFMTPKNNSSSEALNNDQTEVRQPVLKGQRKISVDHENYPLTFATSSLSSSLGFAATGNDAMVKLEVDENGEALTETGEDLATDEAKVSAYARLDFDEFTFYVQTLQVMLGRRAENGSGMVDVHLGPQKAISRKHAKIFYNFGNQRFELSVLGRNGAFVKDQFVPMHSTVALSDKDVIQIGEITFKFVLPYNPNQKKEETPAAEEKEEEEEKKKSVSPSSSQQASETPELATASSSLPTLPTDKPAAKKKEPVKKQPKREYTLEEIPPEYREKPPHSYSHLIATALRERSQDNWLSLSDIYKAIQELFPYYKYCPSGWQNSVRHNLSSNRAFKKLGKNEKGFMWAIDEEYFLEKERQKKRAAENARLKAQAQARAQLRNQNLQAARQQQQQQSSSSNSQQDKDQQMAQQLQQQTDSVQAAAIAVQRELDLNIDPTFTPSSISGDHKEKTIAELAQEIQVNSQGERIYNPKYSAEDYKKMRKPDGSSMSIQDQLAANLQNRRPGGSSGKPAMQATLGSSSSSSTPQSHASLQAGQNTFRMASKPQQSQQQTQQSQQQQQPTTQLTQQQQQQMTTLAMNRKLAAESQKPRANPPPPPPPPTQSKSKVEADSFSKLSATAKHRLYNVQQTILKSVPASADSSAVKKALLSAIVQGARSQGGDLTANMEKILTDKDQLLKVLGESIGKFRNSGKPASTPTPPPPKPKPKPKTQPASQPKLQHGTNTNNTQPSNSYLKFIQPPVRPSPVASNSSKQQQPTVAAPQPPPVFISPEVAAAAQAQQQQQLQQQQQQAAKPVATQSQSQSQSPPAPVAAPAPVESKQPPPPPPPPPAAAAAAAASPVVKSVASPVAAPAKPKLAADEAKIEALLSRARASNNQGPELRAKIAQLEKILAGLRAKRNNNNNNNNNSAPATGQKRPSDSEGESSGHNKAIKTENAVSTSS